MWRKAFFVSLIVTFPVICSAADLFTVNMRFGDVSEQVRLLQQTLNTDPDTTVALDGDGSLGLETTYFGFKTEAAVKKLQLKYKDRILTPAGLTEPSGFVGTFTRIVLNELTATVSAPAKPSTPAPLPTQKSSTVTTTQSATSLSNILTTNLDVLGQNALNFYNKSPSELSQYFNLSTMSQTSLPLASTSGISKEIAASLFDDFASTTFADRHKEITTTLKDRFNIDIDLSEPAKETDVFITGLSTYQAEPGQEIKIYGRNFSSHGNSIHWNDKTTTGITSNASVMIARIPEDVSGRVLVTVENAEHKESDSLALLVYFKNKPAPKITGVDPVPVDFMKPMTLKGSNFGKSNQIHTSFGTMEGVPSVDGRSITFTLSDMPSFSVYKTVKRPNVTTDIAIWIANENGMSEPFGPFKIKL